MFFLVILFFGIVLHLLERFTPLLLPNWFQATRFVVGILASSMILAICFLGVRIQFVNIVIMLIAIAPLTAIAMLSIYDIRRYPLVSSIMLFVLAIFVLISSFSSMGLLAIHNGYSPPFLNVVILFFLTIVINLLLPEGHRYGSWFWDTGRQLWFGSFITVVASWILLSQFIIYQSRKLSEPAQHCIMETDGMRLTNALWLSPRKMFVENSYKGITIPYLQAKSETGEFDYLWSFWAMDFVPNKRYGFTVRSFYQREQLEPPC